MQSTWCRLCPMTAPKHGEMATVKSRQPCIGGGISGCMRWLSRGSVLQVAAGSAPIDARLHIACTIDTLATCSDTWASMQHVLSWHPGMHSSSMGTEQHLWESGQCTSSLTHTPDISCTPLAPHVVRCTVQRPLPPAQPLPQSYSVTRARRCVGSGHVS